MDVSFRRKLYRWSRVKAVSQRYYTSGALQVELSWRRPFWCLFFHPFCDLQRRCVVTILHRPFNSFLSARELDRLCRDRQRDLVCLFIDIFRGRYEQRG